MDGNKNPKSADLKVEDIKLDDDVRAMIHEFARQLSEGEATKADLIPRTCKICQGGIVK